MKLAHIAPAKHLALAAKNSAIHMTVMPFFENPEYKQFWIQYSKENPNAYIILDNGFYELGYSMDLYKCVAMAKEIGAKCVVLPDGDLTQSMLDKVAEIQCEGLEVMAVPVTIEGFVQAMGNSQINKVGLGSIHVAKMLNTSNTFDYRNRAHFLSQFKSYALKSEYETKIHLLGISDNVKEIELCSKYAYSMDTSAAVWRGLHGVDVREPGKFGISLDISSELDITTNSLVKENLKYMNDLAGGNYEQQK